MSYKIHLQEGNISKVENSTVSSVTEQVPGLTYETLTGSEITYTPENGSTWVVYDVQFTCHSRNSAHVGIFSVLTYEESGTESAFEYRFTGDGYNDGGYLIRYKFLIPSYTGSRTWRLKTQYHYGTNWSQDFHEDEDGNQYFPITTMYSIM